MVPEPVGGRRPRRLTYVHEYDRGPWLVPAIVEGTRVIRRRTRRGAGHQSSTRE